MVSAQQKRSASDIAFTPITTPTPFQQTKKEGI